ncbi:hypothetical protein RI367_006103 [Sorochytrium milnesiophthora]
MAAAAAAVVGAYLPRLSSGSAATSWLSALLPRLSPAILLPAILWAVPKSKISHSRKRMRASNKAIKNREDIVRCPCCGSPMLLHHACLTCYNNIRQGPQELRKTA